MATDVEEKRGNEYDDDWQDHQSELKDLEEQAADTSATPRTFSAKRHPEVKSLDREKLNDAEKQAADTEESESEGDAIPYRNENSRVRRILGLKEKQKKQRSKGNVIAKRAAIGSGGAAIALVIMLLIFLSSLKAVHFSEIMSTAGYARFRSVLVERNTQDLFDASVVRGEGEVTLRGRSLLDRFTMRNVEDQLAAMGRDNKFRMYLKDGSLDAMQVGDKTVSLDNLTRQNGWGDSFADLKGGFFDKFNPDKARKVATIRKQFYDQLGSAMDETAGFEGRYIRNGTFNRIADNVGFKWSKWRNAARDFLGKTPTESLVEEKVANAEDVSGQNSITTTDIEQLDISQKAIKNAENIKKYLEKNGGEFDAAAFEASVIADTKTSARIQEISADASMAVLILSLACMANQAFSRIPDIAKKNEDAAARQGLQVLAAGSQIKTGKTTAQAVAANSKVLDGGDKASAYSFMTGREVNSATDVPSIKPSVDPAFADTITKLTSPSRFVLGPLESFAASFLGLDKLTGEADKQFCAAVLSPEGAITIGVTDTVASAVLSFFTAGGEAAAEQGAGRAAAGIFLRELASAFFDTAKGLVSTKSIGTLAAIGVYGVGLELVVDSLAGASFFGAESGPGYVERAAAGTSVVQNKQMRSVYGRPLSKEEAVAVDGHAQTQARQNWQNKGLATRYFGRDNPYSLVGLMSAKTPSSFASVGSIFSSFVSHIGQLFQPSTFKNALSGIFATPKGNKAFAASDPDFDPYYKSTQWGFSADELDKMRSDPTFSIANLDKYLTDEQISHFDQTIGKCFDTSRSAYDLDADPDCSADKLKGDDVLRYRLYKGLDSYIADDYSQNYQAILAGTQ